MSPEALEVFCGEVTLAPGQVAATANSFHHRSTWPVVGVQEELSEMWGRLVEVDLPAVHQVGVD